MLIAPFLTFRGIDALPSKSVVVLVNNQVLGRSFCKYNFGKLSTGVGSFEKA